MGTSMKDMQYLIGARFQEWTSVAHPSTITIDRLGWVSRESMRGAVDP